MWNVTLKPLMSRNVKFHPRPRCNVKLFGLSFPSVCSDCELQRAVLMLYHHVLLLSLCVLYLIESLFYHVYFEMSVHNLSFSLRMISDIIAFSQQTEWHRAGLDFLHILSLIAPQNRRVSLKMCEKSKKCHFLHCFFFPFCCHLNSK